MFKIEGNHPILKRVDMIGDESDIAELKELGYEVSVLEEVSDSTKRLTNDKMVIKEALKLVKSLVENLKTIANAQSWNKKYEKLWMKKLQSYIHLESYLYRTTGKYVENLEKIIWVLSEMNESTDKHEKCCVEFAIYVVKHQEAISSKILVLEKNTLNLLWEIWKEAFQEGYVKAEDNEQVFMNY